MILLLLNPGGAPALIPQYGLLLAIPIDYAVEGSAPETTPRYGLLLALPIDYVEEGSAVDYTVDGSGGAVFLGDAIFYKVAVHPSPSPRRIPGRVRNIRSGGAAEHWMLDSRPYTPPIAAIRR